MLLDSVKYLRQLTPEFANAAQEEYDSWEQSEEGVDIELGAGGLCQNIAEKLADVLSMNGIDAGIVSQTVGEQHVYIIAKLREGVFTVDINPYLYERGSGYRWTKIPGIVFDSNDIEITKIDFDPAEFERYLEG